MAKRGRPVGIPKTGGKKAGTKNKKTLEAEALAERAAASAAGKSPPKKNSLEYFELAMNFVGDLAEDAIKKLTAGEKGVTQEKVIGLLEKLAFFGSKLAPYRHQQLRTVTHRGASLDFSHLSDSELATLRRLTERALGGQLPGDDRRGTETSH